MKYPIQRGRPFIVLLVLWPSIAFGYNREEGQKFHDAYVGCEQLARAKKYDAARSCLSALLPTKPRTRVDIAYRLAELLERKGEFEAARAEFLALSNTFPRDHLAARARFRAARILEDHFDRAADALSEYRRIVREAPDAVGALNALVHIEELLPEVELFEFYDRELVARPGSELATIILSRIGHRALASGQAPRAVKAFDALGKRASSKKDDALFYGAQAHLLAGDIAGAQQRLYALLETRERSPLPGKLIPGNLNSSHMDDARFLLGTIARDRVHDPKQAREHFRTLIDDYPESRLVDDALHALILLFPSDAASLQAELVRVRPNSRFVTK